MTQLPGATSRPASGGAPRVLALAAVALSSALAGAFVTYRVMRSQAEHPTPAPANGTEAPPRVMPGSKSMLIEEPARPVEVMPGSKRLAPVFETPRPVMPGSKVEAPLIPPPASPPGPGEPPKP